ncbi:Regulator of chromosome condensation, RCC1 [Dillenia turbinata]|uniref:Regulator of chromosome condensation, RCC1 n=1 Tax=Dillenia turbinata TaxID=194707 RepID=A0AAN8VW34_9MAGN
MIQVLLKGKSYTAFHRCFSSSRSSWSGAVMSFGDCSQGAIGLPSSLIGGDAYEPTHVPGLPSDVTSVSAGHYHSLAVTAQGEVWAWGRNDELQLGRGCDDPRDSWYKPKRVEGLSQIRVYAAYASGVTSAAVGEDGSLWVWGKSKRGQLGLGKGVIEAVVPSKVEAFNGENIVKVAFGWGHALAQTEDGKLFGWGYMADGRLGKMGRSLEASPLDSSFDISGSDLQISVSTLEAAEKLVLEGMEKEKNMPILWEPCLIQELLDVKVLDVACGLDHSLVLCNNGVLLSSGSNVYGQLGRTVQELGLLPVDLGFYPLSIASGLGHSLGICQTKSSDDTKDDTCIVSWGWNQQFQLGRKGPENLPLRVEGLLGETPLSVSGGRVHSIALTSKRDVWAWGCGKNGRLGLGSSCNEVEPTLVECLEGYEVLQVASGFDHNLVLVAE